MNRNFDVCLKNQITKKGKNLPKRPSCLGGHGLIKVYPGIICEKFSEFTGAIKGYFISEKYV